MNKSDLVSKYIENKIIDGELKPGSKLPAENKLAEMLGVSRVSVRAGIYKLSSMGLLSKKKGGGTYVEQLEPNDYLSNFLTTLQFDQVDYLEMLELRSALDSLSVELCIKHLNNDIIHHLDQIVTIMEKEINSEIFFEYDKTFHLTISQASNNTLLIKINELIWDILEKHAKNQYYSIDNEKRITEHRLILETIIAKDIELAKLYTNRHLIRTINDIESSR